MYGADIYKNFTVAKLCQDIPFRFGQSNIPAPCSKQQIPDRHAEPQEHSSHRHNKSDFQEINVTEGETT
jgi:hypothetical protein